MIETGIFGGSFNPIHCGHIALARQIMRAARMDEVWFVVSPLNPFKQAATDLLDDDRRLEIARQALSDETGLIASDYEFHLPRPSYMWNTLRSLSSDYPERTFSLIIGADNWLAFDRWHRAEDILARYRIIVYPRKGSPIASSSLPPTVRLVDTELYPVSSTQIRERVRRGESIDGMVPPNVISLVERYYSPSPDSASR